MLDKLENTITEEEKAIDNAPELDEGVYSNSSGSVENNTNNISNDKEEDNILDELENDDSDNNIDEEEDNTESIDSETDDEETTDNEEEEVNTNDTKEKDDNSSIIINFGSGEIEVNDVNELQTIASKALKDKTKYDKYKDDIALLEGIKENGLSEEDLYLLVEAKKGNEKAIAKLLKQTNVDPLDLDIEDDSIDSYKPNEYKTDPRIIETKAIIDNLKEDKEVFNKFSNLINNEFDEKSRSKAFEDPTLLEFIGESIKSGLYEKLAPKYMKKKLLGQDPISAYISAYDDFIKSTQEQEKLQIEEESIKDKQKAIKRKKASAGIKKQPKSTAKKKKSFLDMSDEEFEEYYKSKVGLY